MDCPVCKHQMEDAAAKECRNCHSDLTPYFHLRILNKQRNALRAWRSTLVAIVLGGLMILMSVTVLHTNEVKEGTAVESKFAVHKETSEQSMSELEALVEKQNKIISAMEIAIHDKQVFIEHLQDDESGDDVTVHVVKEGETLWSISEKYHGHGFKHDDIADHNEMNDPHIVQTGDTILIKHN